MSDQKTNFDAIVIGAGMTGGWAAKEFCDKGYSTLLLERGRNVIHIKDYPTTNTKPWEFKHKGNLTFKEKEENPIVGKCYAFREDTTHFFAKDKDHPYIQEKPFDWIKGYQVGGRSIMWARQTQRWSEFDFEGPARDGFAVDWPIRYDDLKDWYTYVEEFVGITGTEEGLEELPDGVFLKPWELNIVEKHFKKSVSENFENRHVIYARAAHLTESKPIFVKQGRGLCQNRTICERGCPFGGYFNANSTLIPWANKTGNLTLRPHSVVHSIIYDEGEKKATGVRIIDAETKEVTEFFAKVIFVNAGTLNSNLILLNSKSERFPNGIGNDNGLLGKHVAFHNYRGIVAAEHPGYNDYKEEGRRPTSCYIPRFRNLRNQDKDADFIRGYAVTFGAGRGQKIDGKGIGQELFDNLTGEKEYGPWRASSRMMGETIPKETNYVSLNESQKDEWGIPLLNISIDYDENDEKMLQDFFVQVGDMYEKAGFTNIRKIDTKQAPGFDIHEMGGVRMGHDAKTSMLNEWNQMHLVPNVFVTDGACMTSMATQNPSLTFMALTARAAKKAMEMI